MLYEYTRVAVEGHAASARILAHRWVKIKEGEEERTEPTTPQNTSQPLTNKRRMEAGIARARKVMKTAWGGA